MKSKKRINRGRFKRDLGPRVNQDIKIAECRLIGAEGKAYGIVSLEEARRMARNEKLDLVEISPNARPPVIKMIDYGKFKYNQQKKANEAKKKQAVTQLKEVQFRPNIGTHDLETKIKNIERFLTQGDKVKLVMQFRGREMAHRESGIEKFKGIIQDVEKMGAIVESDRKMVGNRIITILAADKKALQKYLKEKAFTKSQEVDKKTDNSSES